ncbi:MAG: sulfur carrier protein ThiS [Dehalococcoidia bacterium]
MKITLNGKPHQLAGPTSVADLLRALDINAGQVAVALNGEVLPRDRWTQIVIADGDTVEVVRAVGGGSLAA